MGGNNSKPRKVAVFGGGLTGLTATYCLLASDPDVEIDLYESSSRFGGAVLTENDGGFQFDLGPNSMNAKHAAVADLIYGQLSLGDRIAKRKSSTNFLIAKKGKLVSVPFSPTALLRSPLLSWRAKVRLLFEPFIRRTHKDSAELESVATFFSRRFGREVVTYVIDPAVAGIYSVSPTQLSMKHAFGRLWEVERAKGSILGGALLGGFKAQGDPRFPGYNRKQLMESFSYDGGMSVLVDTLVDRIKEQHSRVHLYRKKPVYALNRHKDSDKWTVNEKKSYDAVISTIPTHNLSEVGSNVRSVRRGLHTLAGQISYASVSVLVFGYDRSQIPDNIHGYGTLFPTREGRKILGVNFTSEGFPGRLTDKNKVFWTVYLGGGRNPDLPSKSTKEIIDVASTELQDAFGVKGNPSFVRVKNWHHGIPTYSPGHEEALCTMTRIEKKAKGLVFAGNYRDGVGVPDALLSGIQSAERTSKYLGSLSR